MWRAARGEPMPRHLISLHRIPEHDEVRDGSVGALAALRRVERGPATGAQRALTMAASVTAGPTSAPWPRYEGDLASGFPQAAWSAPCSPSTSPSTSATASPRPSPRWWTRDCGPMTSSPGSPTSRRDAGWTGSTVKLSRRGWTSRSPPCRRSSGSRTTRSWRRASPSDRCSSDPPGCGRSSRPWSGRTRRGDDPRAAGLRARQRHVPRRRRGDRRLSAADRPGGRAKVLLARGSAPTASRGRVRPG